MKHIVVDLEMNPIKQNSPARAFGSNEIIEIGAVMLDDNLTEVSSFRSYVKPQFNDGITNKIRKLTGISTEMVANAPTFETAFRMFTSWCLGTGDEIKIHAWSDSDYIQVMKEIRMKEYEISDDEKIITADNWDDFQLKFDSRLNFERQVKLSTALDMAGIEFEGREHDALDDARNTAELLKVFSDKELFDSTLKKIEEVMTPTNIGCSLGSMFDFSAFLSA